VASESAKPYFGRDRQMLVAPEAPCSLRSWLILAAKRRRFAVSFAVMRSQPRRLALGYLLAAVAAACSSTGPAQAPPLTDSAELLQLYEADQKDREGSITQSIDWTAVSARDAERRNRVREIIKSGGVRTGKDYERAAMVFQHGSTPDDILMAHVLAVTALGKGNTDARWLSAAALDRFLHQVKQPQVFGTQFQRQEGQPWTMEPYNRTLIDARVRADNCVPDHDHQARALDALNKGEEPPSPSRPPCADSQKP
jgi:hypothetical protein